MRKGRHAGALDENVPRRLNEQARASDRGQAWMKLLRMPRWPLP